MGDLARNIEIKARLRSLKAAREVAAPLATEYLGFQHQIDTYFHSPQGRLKLREISGETAQLVWYDRLDATGPKASHYYLAPVGDPTQLKQALVAAMGVRTVVEKSREIFLYQNVRIHLDEVVGLGTFLEFEAVLAASQSEQEGQDQVEFLKDQFGILPDDLLAGSYCDFQE